jgi:hypothetical protein
MVSASSASVLQSAKRIDVSQIKATISCLCEETRMVRRGNSVSGVRDDHIHQGDRFVSVHTMEVEFGWI